MTRSHPSHRRHPSLRLDLLIGGITLLCAALSVARCADARPTAAGYAGGGRLSLVARFPNRQITGIAVAPDGRMFVNLPRWTVDVPVSVAEVVGGALRPYPDVAWNAWRNRAPLAPRTHFVCVQSVVMDPSGKTLWVLDPGSPDMSGPVKNAPKLVAIDLATNRVTRTIAFDARIAPPGSYLNDVRFSPDSQYAYMSDSGIRGSLVVLDLSTGASRRVLDGAPATQFDPTVTVMTDGKPLRRPDGRTLQAAVDGIALSRDGATFYWQALDGDTLYSIPTSVLKNETSIGTVAAAVHVVAKTHPADGLWIDSLGELFVSDPGRNLVQVGRDGPSLHTLVADPRLRWPDSFAEGVGGTVYVTTSHIQDSPWFHPGVVSTPSEIWKIVPESSS